MRKYLKLSLFFLVFVLFLPGYTNASTKSYTIPGPSAPKPHLPELYANEGQTFHAKGITVTVLPGTVAYDSYLTFDVVDKVNPIRIARYWQVSDIYEVWIRSHFNEAKVRNPERGSIIVIPYKDSDLRVSPFLSFPESSLKVVCSPDGGATWTMERSTSIDTRAKTVSAITDIGGGCMLMTGFVPATQYNNFSSVKGAFVSNQSQIQDLIAEDLQEAPLRMRLTAAVGKSIEYVFYGMIRFLNLFA